MTANRPQKRQPPSRPNRPVQANSDSAETTVPKPYALVSFPNQPPKLEHPIGHDRFRADRLHGTIDLTLKVQTAVHISTGIVALGEDVKQRTPLIKTMIQGNNQTLMIPGSSLKGVVRSAYEAITNSTLAVVTGRYKDKMPDRRLPCRDKKQLCPASRVFGALDWQGLVHFADAKCEKAESVTGFMPSLYRPRPDQRKAYFVSGKAAGRKFYYHAVKAVSGGDRGIPVQQAGTEYTFSTQLHFKNLTAAELGALFIVLGQDDKYPMALKVGGGKPIGMGTLTVTLKTIERVQNLRDRYTSYQIPDTDRLTENALQKFVADMIQAAHQDLVLSEQLQQLAEILQWPTNRTAPEGMY